MISLINHDCSVLWRGQLFFLTRGPQVSPSRKWKEHTYPEKSPTDIPWKIALSGSCTSYSERPAQILHNVYIYIMYTYTYLYIYIVIQYNGWMIWIRDMIGLATKFLRNSTPFPSFPITAVTFSRSSVARLRFWCGPRDFGNLVMKSGVMAVELVPF